MCKYDIYHNKILKILIFMIRNNKMMFLYLYSYLSFYHIFYFNSVDIKFFNLCTILFL